VPVTVTITEQPSGAVVATGGDQLAHELLKHAGFTRHADWYGVRFRLATSMFREEQWAVVGDAVRMLTAARYEVVASASLSPAGEEVPVGEQVLGFADRVRAADNGAELSRVLVELVDPEQGVLIRLQEALEAAAEQVTELDPEACELSDRLGGAAESLYAVNDELFWVVEDTSKLSSGPSAQPSVASVAQASSPAAATSATAAAPSPPVPPASTSSAAVRPSR